MLKQSELNTPTSRRLHKLETKFRIMPRSFGQYQILGATVTACESEEICIASESLSYEEHLKARQLDLAVEVLHNGSPYIYYWKLSRLFKVNWFSVIEETYAFLLTTDTTLFKDFDTWAREFYFNSEAELTSYVHAHIMELISRTDGTNEMSRAKAIAFFAEGERIHKSIAQILAQRVLRLASVDSQVQLQQFLREVYEITELKRRHILNPHFVEQTEVTFDFSRLDVESEWLDLGNYELVSPRKCFIWYDNDQKQLLSSYFRLYGTASIDGLGRLLMRSRLIDILARVSFNLPSDIINDGDLHAQTSDSSSYFSYS